jgi:hypothetical protein
VDPQRKETSRGVVLPPEHTGSSLFHAVLVDAAAQFPKELAVVRLPDQPGAWKGNYGALLARFEAQRVCSARRVEIARYIQRRAQAALLYAQDGATQPLAEYLAGPEPTPELQSIQVGAAPALRAQVPLDGRVFRGREVLALIDQLAAHGDLTLAAQRALCWIVEHIEQRGGVLDLRGERFVLLGAAAELAATAMLLQAGATVLWVDLSDPGRWLAERDMQSGTVQHCANANNLLEQPRAIRAAIERFADSGPVHLGLFAYASGASQEWRLGAAMNAIASHLPPDSVRSVSMLVSPTTVPTLQPESVAAAARQLETEPLWKSALSRAGLLRKPGYSAAGGVKIGLATVSVQGLSYQAAQYISKLATAESFAAYGVGWDAAAPRPVTVSANVAGITRTRSLSHPLFAAAFVGAPRFGVRIFDPQTTRALSGLLILHDLLNPAAAGSATVTAEPAAKAAGLFSQQVHGGIYNLPYPLEQAIRIAALIGMGQRPSVLLQKPARSARAIP